MVSPKLREGISETLDILNHMEKSYVDKISAKFIDFLEKNKSATYVSNLDHSKTLKELELKEETKDLLAIIYMKYWCAKEESDEYKKMLIKNEKDFQENLRKYYDSDNIFKNKSLNN